MKRVMHCFVVIIWTKGAEHDSEQVERKGGKGKSKGKEV